MRKTPTKLALAPHTKHPILGTSARERAVKRKQRLALTERRARVNALHDALFTAKHRDDAERAARGLPPDTRCLHERFPDLWYEFCTANEKTKCFMLIPCKHATP